MKFSAAPYRNDPGIRRNAIPQFNSISSNGTWIGGGAQR
jgi:hypothetical protein